MKKKTRRPGSLVIFTKRDMKNTRRDRVKESLDAEFGPSPDEPVYGDFRLDHFAQ